MRVITDTQEVTIKVTKEDVLYDEWIPFENLSNKLKALENDKSREYKYYRQRLYNDYRGGRLNGKVFAGIKCVNIKDPMNGTASLKLNFVMEEK